MLKAIKFDKKYSYNEYLKLEKETHEKHDFYFGEVYNMAGGTIKHNELIQEIIILFRKKNKKKCKILFNDVKLELIPDEYFVYPDLMLTCDKDDLKNNKDTIIKKPFAIVEVLSKSTEMYDRNVKLKYYLKISSLKYYVLVSQEAIRVEVYERVNSHWEYRFFEKEDEIIKFKQLDFNIFVKDIYQNI